MLLADATRPGYAQVPVLSAALNPWPAGRTTATGSAGPGPRPAAGTQTRRRRQALNRRPPGPTPRAPAALAEHRTSRILPNTGTAPGGPPRPPRTLNIRATRRYAAA